MEIPFPIISDAASECGLQLAGVIDAEELQPRLQKHFHYLQAWQQQGFAGEMHYMNRPAEFIIDCEKFLPAIGSIVCFAINYRGEEQSAHLTVPRGFGRVARYAWGRDYHKVLRGRMTKFVDELRKQLPDINFMARAFTDAVPLLERALFAEVANGFIGKNTMFILPQLGSYTFLAEVLLSVGVTDVPKALPVKGHCGTCARCLSACPTSAFQGPYVLDARRCISYLTIEKKTVFSDWESQAIGNWIFGCDVCQDVCPFNPREQVVPSLKEFSVCEGSGVLLNLAEVLSFRTNRLFLNKFQGTALMRAGREALLRNACSIAINTNCQELIPDLQQCLREETSEIIYSAAAQALKELRCQSLAVAV